jgi:translocation and assembly module TamB
MFQDFAFDSLDGTVNYEGDTVAFDVRLQQTPTEWLVAKGRTPMTLFQAAPEGTAAGAHIEPSPGDMVDIEVSSSEIGLGFIQGFTSDVTDITGVLQANLRMTGSGHDPHVTGAIEVRGGSFALPEFGTTYTGLDTRIDLTPQGVTIQDLRILDARGFPTTVGGTLGFHARTIGAVDVRLRSEKFEVIDNDLADIKLNSDIRIRGEIGAPRIEGSIDVENGTIHLAQLLDRVTADAYATEAAVFGPVEPGAAPADVAPPEEPSMFDAMTLDIVLKVPNNLVLRGDDIRAANASVSLGDMNVTVGGDLQIGKRPSDPVRVVGQVNTVRGNYTFQGRRFEIVRDGQLGVSGADEIDPRLDLQARRVISGIETFVRVRGTMTMPELSFSSNPPLDEADILSLIIFNQPVNQLGEGQQVSLAQRASALASGYLTSGLSRSIGNALELDEFEIQAQGEQGGGPTVTVGEQIGRNLFFRLRQGFGTEQTTELILEYQIADFLRAQGSVAEGTAATQRVQFRRIERGGLDLIFFFSY